jgi:hypothetical protein
MEQKTEGLFRPEPIAKKPDETGIGPVRNPGPLDFNELVNHIECFLSPPQREHSTSFSEFKVLQRQHDQCIIT